MQLLSATIVLFVPIFGHVEILNLFEVKNLCLSILYVHDRGMYIPLPPQSRGEHHSVG